MERKRVVLHPLLLVNAVHTLPTKPLLQHRRYEPMRVSCAAAHAHCIFRRASCAPPQPVWVPRAGLASSPAAGLLGMPPHGVITNRHSILDDVDKVLSEGTTTTSSTTPSGSHAESEMVEYLWVEANAPPGNCFGHTAVAYRHPETKQRVVMNIVHDAVRGGSGLVNFLPQEEYLFGLSDLDKNEQGGVYNRNIYGLRLYGLTTNDVSAMHYQFVALRFEANAGRALFRPLGTRWIPRTLIARVMPWIQEGARYGNCARWTSKGLLRAGVIRRESYFPKHMLVRLMIDHSYLRSVQTMCETSPPRRRVELVHYQRIEGVPVHRLYPHKPFRGLLTPLHWYHNWAFWDLRPFVSCVVRVPAGCGTAAAVVEKVPDCVRRPVPVDWWTRQAHYLSMTALVALLYWCCSAQVATGVAVAAMFLW